MGRDAALVASTGWGAAALSKLAAPAVAGDSAAGEIVIGGRLVRPKLAGIAPADDAVTLFQNRLGGVALAPETRAPLVQYLDATSSGIRGPFALNAKTVDVKVRNMLRLMLSAPEYQLS